MNDNGSANNDTTNNDTSNNDTTISPATDPNNRDQDRRPPKRKRYSLVSVWCVFLFIKSQYLQLHKKYISCHMGKFLLGKKLVNYGIALLAVAQSTAFSEPPKSLFNTYYWMKQIIPTICCHIFLTLKIIILYSYITSLYMHIKYYSIYGHTCSKPGSNFILALEDFLAITIIEHMPSSCFSLQVLLYC